MSSPVEILALAKTIQAHIDEICPDHDPLKMRAAVLLVGEAYLQVAVLDRTIAELYRSRPNK